MHNDVNGYLIRTLEFHMKNAGYLYALIKAENSEDSNFKYLDVTSNFLFFEKTSINSDMHLDKILSRFNEIYIASRKLMHTDPKLNSKIREHALKLKQCIESASSLRNNSDSIASRMFNIETKLDEYFLALSVRLARAGNYVQTPDMRLVTSLIYDQMRGEDTSNEFISYIEEIINEFSIENFSEARANITPIMFHELMALKKSIINSLSDLEISYILNRGTDE